MTLRTKLLSGFIVLIMIPLFLLGTIAFFVSQHMIENKYSELNEVTLKAVSLNIENVINEMNHLSKASIVNPTVQRILSKDTAHMNPTELRLQIINAEKAMKKILYTYPFVHAVMLYDRSGVLYKVGRFDFEPIRYGELVHHPVFAEAISREGAPKWIGPYRFPDLTGNDAVLTQIRIVKDIETFENKGVLILQTKFAEIEDIFEEIGRESHFLIVNRNGLIFYDNEHHLQGETLSALMDEKEKVSLPADYQTFRASFAGKESVISVNGLSVEKWRVLSVRSWHSLSQEMITLAKWIVGITALCLIAALLFNILFVNRTAGAIIDVVRAMKRVEKGDLQTRTKVEGSGETKELSVGFNSLVSRVGSLLQEVEKEQERKKKAEMMLMQAQIRPHFLFNTLESINVLAVQNQGRKVSRMIHQLGRILRISIEEDEEITIRQEIDHLKSYLEIQKFRFEDMFDYEIDIPEAMLDFAVLKLTLQPLVENALQHGFAELDHKGTLKVSAADTGDQLEFFIRDNGAGFPESVLFQLQMTEPDVKLEREGLGIRNVVDRIQIRYGKAYGLFICSNRHEGTIIKCVIPKYHLGDRYGTD
ncbi:MAG TPA: sensor histidine kinase [Bacillales bacterium]